MFPAPIEIGRVYLHVVANVNIWIWNVYMGHSAWLPAGCEILSFCLPWHKIPFQNINKQPQQPTRKTLESNSENGINDSLGYFSENRLFVSFFGGRCQCAQTCHANSTFIKSHQTRLTNNGKQLNTICQRPPAHKTIHASLQTKICANWTSTFHQKHDCCRENWFAKEAKWGGSNVGRQISPLSFFRQ